VNRDEKLVHVLLVYHKADLGDGDETARWHTLVKKNHPETSGLFGL
jgi:ribosome biogenesis GTPase A